MPRDERTYPNRKSGNFAFHLFRYVWAIPFAYDRVVLDAGCGSGYGADLLASVASEVVGVDYDAEAVAEDRRRYAHRTNLSFRVEDVADLSFQDGCFDLIVSFEVYEHLEVVKSGRFVHHLSRLCRPGGRVLLSTPNRLVEKPFMKSAGQSYRYHVNSVSPRELKARLTPHFRSVRLFGQRVRAGPLKGLLRALDAFNLRHRLVSYGAQKGLERVLSEESFSLKPDLMRICITPSLIRQSGIILALCSK